jgi:hypothetical protein
MIHLFDRFGLLPAGKNELAARIGVYVWDGIAKIES